MTPQDRGIGPGPDRGAARDHRPAARPADRRAGSAQDFTDATNDRRRRRSRTSLRNGWGDLLPAGSQPAGFVADLFAGLGDRVWILDRSGARIAATSQPPQVTSAQLSRGQAATRAAVYQRDDYVLAVAPIRSDNGAASLGVVALARPTASVDHRVVLLWTVIGAVSAAGLLAAALVAIGLARWVSRPLGTLEHAAQQLGDGNLSTRSPVETGPREVRQLAANFNLMAARLEALVHGHQATMADVSHQLDSLAALRLRLELLAQDSTEPVSRAGLRSGGDRKAVAPGQRAAGGRAGGANDGRAGADRGRRRGHEQSGGVAAGGRGTGGHRDRPRRWPGAGAARGRATRADPGQLARERAGCARPLAAASR